jgi:hypothetical protein
MLRGVGPQNRRKELHSAAPARLGQERISSTVDGGAAAAVAFINKDKTKCGNDKVGYKADIQTKWLVRLACALAERQPRSRAPPLRWLRQPRGRSAYRTQGPKEQGH